MVDRYRLSTGDDKVLDEWYPSVKAGLKYMQTLDTDGNGILNLKGAQYYDAWSMVGEAPHVATYWMATLKIVERMARMQNDTVFAEECRDWYERARNSMEEVLWNEETQSYLLYNNIATGKKSDTILSDQLIGEWFVRIHGLPSIFSPTRIKTVLSTVERLNMSATQYGVRTAMRPDGSEDQSPGGYAQFMTPSYSSTVPAALMIYTDDSHLMELGMEIMRRTWHNMFIRQNMTWDMPCMVRVDGTPALGLEYYHNTMFWTLPTAVLGQDLRTACSPGGFYYKIIQAQ